MIKRTPYIRFMFLSNLWARRFLDSNAGLLWLFAVALLVLAHQINTGFQ